MTGTFPSPLRHLGPRSGKYLWLGSRRREPRLGRQERPAESERVAGEFPHRVKDDSSSEQEGRNGTRERQGSADSARKGIAQERRIGFLGSTPYDDP